GGLKIPAHFVVGRPRKEGTDSLIVPNYRPVVWRRTLPLPAPSGSSTRPPLSDRRRESTRRTPEPLRYRRHAPGQGGPPHRIAPPPAPPDRPDRKHGRTCRGSRTPP